ncbi:MAG: helix-turn-helix transcriptional regulator, partial [Parabacteroides sp.]|nr:helix-turn-helix transcriptional regulator [Parabacteroides sp.]
LTPARFAESIGIQRSAMSHIASGRNNPSLDVVTKILERYPYIDSEWLLFGKGSMCKTMEENTNEAPSLFSESGVNRPEVQAKTEYARETEVKMPVYERKQPEIEKVIYKETPSKTISKIMVFYSDNTFDTFVLEKNQKD